MAGRRIAMSAAFEKYSGELDSQFYLRTLVKDKSKVMAVCKKPRLTKAQRKKMAERPQIKRFNAVTAEAQVIYHDPVLRAEWEKKHAAVGFHPPYVEFSQAIILCSEPYMSFI